MAIYVGPAGTLPEGFYIGDYSESGGGPPPSTKISSGLVPITTGGQTGWEVGLTPSEVRITVNSGADLANGGLLEEVEVFIKDTADETLGYLMFDFNTWAEEIILEIPLSFVGNDIGRIEFIDELRNNGPIISLIQFYP